MKTPPFQTRVVGFLLVVLAALLVLWIIVPETPSVRLADGSTLKLEFVRYQHKDSQTQRLPWLNKFRDWLAQKLGRPTFSFRQAPADSLVYWISRREKDTGKYMDFDWLSHAVAVDGHGCEFNTILPLMVHTHNWAGGSRPLPKAPAGAKYILASGVLPAFPRREKTFELRVYDNQLALVGKFEVPNPMYRHYPTWKAEKLPDRHSAGGMTASLVSLSNRWTSARNDGVELGHFDLTPAFQIAPNWELGDLDVEDATGNRGIADHFGSFERLHRRMHGLRSGETLSAQFKLCTNESAWKLRATFFRTAQARFASNEVWTIPNLKIPTAGTANILDASNSWQGATVRLCASAGPGTFTYSNGVPVKSAIYSGGGGVSSSGRSLNGVSISEITVNTGKPQVMLQISGLNPESRFQVIARINGQIHICRDSTSGNEYKLLQLEVPERTDSVELTLVIQQPRAIDFLIRPELPRDR